MNDRTETPYVETEALLALLNDDEERALALIADMLPNERASFAKVAARLAALTDGHCWCFRCGAAVALADSVTTFARPSRTYHRACLAAERTIYDPFREGASGVNDDMGHVLTDAELDAAIARNIAELDAHDPGWRDWPVPRCRHVNCLADDHREVAGAIRGLDNGLFLRGDRLVDWLDRQRDVAG